MAVEKYNYSVTNKNFMSGLKDFFVPLWNWKKVEFSEDMVISASNNPFVKLYVDDNTFIYFLLSGYNSSNNNCTISITLTSDSFSMQLISLADFYINETSLKTNVRFTKVGDTGFFIGFDCYKGYASYYPEKNGDYTKPIIMCCDIGSTYALVSCGLTVSQTTSSIPSATTNKIFYDGMTAIETVSLTRRTTEKVEQLVPICTNSGLYSANGFTPAITYNNTLSPQEFTLNGQKYYGNGLMVLLDEE